MSFETVMREARKQALFTTRDTTQAINFGIAEIHQLLPHRSPMLLLDRIETLDLDESELCASRIVDSADPLFAGHFPGEPVYPGVMLIEAMSQAAICLQLLLDNRGKLPHTPPSVRLLRVHDALFQEPVLPGFELTIRVKAYEERSYSSVYTAQVVAHDKICAVAMSELLLVS